MIDLHMHTILSDGVLLPFEQVRRCMHAGYEAMAITDHVDASNIDVAVPRLVAAIEALSSHVPIEVIPGAEVTHAPPELVAGLVQRARELGAKLVVVHGETIVEPVAPGTNRAGIEAGADILSHPGLISADDVELARERDVALEITARKGHSLGNGRVAALAIQFGASLVINTDAHGPSDLISKEMAEKILQGAGLGSDDIERCFENSRRLVDKALRRNNA
jgi:putative hydrolase